LELVISVAGKVFSKLVMICPSFVFLLLSGKYYENENKKKKSVLWFVVKGKNSSFVMEYLAIR